MSITEALKHTVLLGQKMELAKVTPKTLYLSRNVLNGDDIAKWAKSVGLTGVDPKLLHCTIAYSKEPVNWMKLGNGYYGGGSISVKSGSDSKPAKEYPEGSIVIPAGGPRLIERFDGGAIVLLFACDEFGYRNGRVTDIGGSWDWPSYIPHITLQYDKENEVDLSQVKMAYQGEIVFGPEIFAEVNEDWKKDNYGEKASVMEGVRKALLG